MFSFWAILFPFYSPNSPKNENFKTKKKKSLEISSFYTRVLKIMIRCYAIPEILHVSYVIVIVFWGAIVSPFTPLTAQKMKTYKKWKKHLDISSFNTNVPNIIIICYIAPEIWHMPDVIVIFHLGLFLPFYSPNNTKKLTSQ